MVVINDVLWLLVLIVVGTLIGGGTNIVAIRMIFRPYRAYYIGSFQVPFTPGLIPKRREEIAEQLGKMVAEHLITPKGLAEKILHQSFILDIEDRLQKKLHSFLEQEVTLNDWLNVHVRKYWSVQKARMAIEKIMKEKIISIINENKHRPFKELMSRQWTEKVVEDIPKLTNKLLKKGEEYFQTDEGKRQIELLVEQFFESRGSVANVIGRVVQRASPAKMIGKEITKLFQQQQTHDLVNEWLMKEWNDLIDRTPEEIIAKLDVEGNIERLVKSIVDETPIIGEWDKPLNTWALSYEKIIVDTVFPPLMEGFTLGIRKNLHTMLKRVGIKDIVKNQINHFPLIRLEKMLLAIVQRELKMIAVLGAFIGGFVGLIQGIVIIFFLN